MTFRARYRIKHAMALLDYVGSDGVAMPVYAVGEGRVEIDVPKTGAVLSAEMTLPWAGIGAWIELDLHARPAHLLYGEKLRVNVSRGIRSMRR